jgi:antitoxin MazE
MRTNIAKWGNSLAVRLPRQVAEAANLQEGAEVEITVRDGELTISPKRPRYQLSELLADYKPQHRHAETAWDGPKGKPRGKEEW